MKYFIVFISLLFANQLFADNTMFENGKRLYEETCISCHGVDGKAKTDMKLIVKPRDLTLTILDEEQTYQIAKEGARHWGAKADIMPGFKFVFNEDQLRAVSHYIHKNFNPNLDKRLKELCSQCEKESTTQDKKMAKWGKKIFNRNCQFCHGVEGKGDGVATTSPVDSIFPYDLTKTLLTKQQIFLYVKYGGKHFGTDKTDMPSWKKKYNDFRLHAIAKYIDEVIRKKD
jgi:mono/diheme cytochrome c family protein